MTLEFLRETHYYRVGKSSVQWVGIGDWNKEPAARQVILGCLRRVQTVVANMAQWLKVYRAEHSWYHAFTAFRLPSPQAAAASADGRRSLHPQVATSLERISAAAKIPSRDALDDVLRLLPRAERHQANGVDADAAWGRASAEWPELKEARSLVDLFLVWKTATGKLER